MFVLVWNTHSRVGEDIARAHIAELSSLSPPVTISSPLITATVPPEGESLDLDSPEEIAIRSLLLGIVHRTAREYGASREFLVDAHSRQNTLKISTWVGGVACFELAVLELKETEIKVGRGNVVLDASKKAAWTKALNIASGLLDQALSLAPQSVDLSSRLDTRISMLRDEIAIKREMLV